MRFLDPAANFHKKLTNIIFIQNTIGLHQDRVDQSCKVLINHDYFLLTPTAVAGVKPLAASMCVIQCVCVSVHILLVPSMLVVECWSLAGELSLACT